MKIIEIKNREKYLSSQIDRSNDKFDYNKVSYLHTLNFYRILRNLNESLKGPIICLGSRHGREIDLFRNIFFGNKIFNIFIRLFEIRRYGWLPLFKFLESFNRSSLNKLNDESVIGVEINPRAKRRDTHIGSFDEMPKDFSNKFSILYSNSFDQSQDPVKTALEWKRIIKDGGIMIIGFTKTEATPQDPVGDLHFEDIINLFNGELLYYRKNGSNYNDIILKIKK